MTMENEHLVIENFLILRNAIIKQAIDDYKYLCRKGKKVEGAINISEIERFFKNDCYGLLSDTDISGKDILKQLYSIKNVTKRNRRIDK